MDQPGKEKKEKKNMGQGIWPIREGKRKGKRKTTGPLRCQAQAEKGGRNKESCAWHMII